MTELIVGILVGGEVEWMEVGLDDGTSVIGETKELGDSEGSRLLDMMTGCCVGYERNNEVGVLEGMHAFGDAEGCDDIF